MHLYETTNGYVTECDCCDHPPILLVFGNIAIYLEVDAFMGLTDFLYGIDSDCFKNENMPNGRKIVINTGMGQMYWLLNEDELQELQKLLAEAVLAFRVRQLLREEAN